jgi:hypothetical protein
MTEGSFSLRSKLVLAQASRKLKAGKSSSSHLGALTFSGKTSRLLAAQGVGYSQREL